MKEIINNPALAGQLAGPKEYFGEPNDSQNRYAVFPVHTNTDKVQWCVADAFVGNYASVIRKASTKSAAVAGLSSFPILKDNTGRAIYSK